MRELSDVMREERQRVIDLSLTETAGTWAMSVQMAVLNEQPTALRTLLAAVYLAGMLDAEDARPDPDVWDVDLSGEVMA